MSQQTVYGPKNFYYASAAIKQRPSHTAAATSSKAYIRCLSTCQCADVSRLETNRRPPGDLRQYLWAERSEFDGHNDRSHK
ncbi:hypothetical protein Trydic_g15858 [Trypoxylus dichotomus]